MVNLIPNFYASHYMSLDVFLKMIILDRTYFTALFFFDGVIALFFTDVIYSIVYFRPEVSSHSLDVSLKFVLHIKIALLVTSIDMVMMNYNFKNIVTKFSDDIRFKCSKNVLKIISIS